MFGLTPDEKYQKYLRWFAKQVADENNWAALRADKDCSNYHLTDRDGQPIDPGKPIPYSRGEALFRMGDPKKMAKAIEAKFIRQREYYADLSQYVNGDPNQGKLNPEYLARFENTEKLRKQLKAYTGSSEAASDELFRLKTEADEKGQDFSLYASQKVEEMKGEHLAAPEFERSLGSEPSEPALPKKSLAGKFLHFLWKKGLPVHSLIQKELDVEIADHTGKDSSWKSTQKI